MKTLEQLKAEAAELGIAEGAKIRTATTNSFTEILGDPSTWTMCWSGNLWSKSQTCLFDNKSGNWATVITPAPSKEEGLRKGDSVECGVAMRAAIMELAKDLGLATSNLENGHVEGLTVVGDRTIQHCSQMLNWKVRNGYDLVLHTPEAFMAKLRITAALPKPEPPILIKVGEGVNTEWHEVVYRHRSIKIGCTVLENATVRSIASKLID